MDTMNLTAKLAEELKKEKEKTDATVRVGNQILFLTKEECSKVGPSIEETLEIVEKTLIAHGNKEYEMPAKIGIHPYADVFYHAMPAYVPNQLACGMKWVECYPRNPKEYNLPQTSSLLILNEIQTGFPVSVMDGSWLTAMRTPAVTAIAAAKLHPDAETFGMFGCGVQGVGHVQFVSRTLKNLKKIYIYDVKEAVMDALIEAVKGDVKVEIIKAKSPKEVMDNCDVLSSATLITKDNLAIVKADWVRAGQTILPCDLNTFWEASIQTNADKYFVDSRDEHELFDGMGYFPDGLPHILGETGEVIAGLIPGRQTKEEVIVCSNIGMAVFDVAMAKAIFDRALAQGVGTILSL